MKTSREQLWFLWLLVFWGCCFVETANITRNDANQPPRASNTKTGNGGKKKAENNMAMQKPQTLQGSLYNDNIKLLIFACPRYIAISECLRLFTQ